MDYDAFQQKMDKLHNIVGSLQSLRGEDTLRLTMALDLAGIGMWDWNIKQNNLYWNHTMCKLFDESYEDVKTHETFFNKVILEDREKVQQAIDNCIINGVPYEIDYTILWKDKSLHKIHTRGMRYPDIINPDKLIGVCMIFAK